MKTESTSEYQLGFSIGELILHRYLPTLSIDSLQTSHVIPVTLQETEEFKKLDDNWFNTLRSESKLPWKNLQQLRRKLEKKYIPQELDCHFYKLIIYDMVIFKKGLRDSLWHSDLCHYKIEKDEDLIITNDSDLFTLITLKYDDTDHLT